MREEERVVEAVVANTTEVARKFELTEPMRVGTTIHRLGIPKLSIQKGHYESGISDTRLGFDRML